MPKSYLNASNYGLGELITRKKNLFVPLYQRDYSWSEDEVEQFLDDIMSSIERDADDYFLGLVVLVGPIDGGWLILDGQQRLATTTIVYSSLRHLLLEEGFANDSQQIEGEFIGIRKLGGEPTPRLKLNITNREVFEKLVIQKASDSDLSQFLWAEPKNSSCFRLITAASTCRAKIRKWAAAQESDTTARLYKLANFLETQAQIVCLEIESETDAYIIFESLNHRGNALSALDLVKTHIFSKAGKQNEGVVNLRWQSMLQFIADRDADDFLKMFWTFNYGRIQRGDLFRQIKRVFDTKKKALELSERLLSGSEQYASIDDSSSELWAKYGAKACEYIDILNIIKSKQIRPIILAVINKGFSALDVERVLWNLIVTIVRYQTIGRRRTGVLEIACAKIAQMVTAEMVKTNSGVVSELRRITPSDDDFIDDFRKYSDSNPKRIAYILSSIEAHLTDRPLYDVFHSSAVVNILPKTAKAETLNLFLKYPEVYEEHIDRLGNKALIKKTVNSKFFANFWHDPKMLNQYKSNSKIPDEVEDFDFDRLRERQANLAELAKKVWQFVA